MTQHIYRYMLGLMKVGVNDACPAELTPTPTMSVNHMSAKKKRKEDTTPVGVNEKPSIIPGCPGT